MNADIIIIGGGIAGLSAAARLSADASVILLEAEDSLGYHTSGRSAALYEEHYGLPSTVALNRASKAYLTEAQGGYLSPRGLLIIAREDEEAAFRKDAEALHADDIPLDQASAMVPVIDREVTAFAAYHEGAFDIDTDRLMQDFRREILHRGGKVLTKHRVNGLQREGDGWQVSAGAETLRCAKVVNATGAWADGIAELAGLPPVGIVPHRRSMARVPAPEGQDITHWPIFFGINETWYAKPDAGALIISPADETPVAPHDAWAEDMTLAEGIARYEAMVTTPVTRLIASWAGLRSFSPDRALVLGPDPQEPSFVWSAAQGGYGFQTAPAASQLVADLTFGRNPSLDPAAVAALTVARFER